MSQDIPIAAIDDDKYLEATAHELTSRLRMIRIQEKNNCHSSSPPCPSCKAFEQSRYATPISVYSDNAIHAEFSIEGTGTQSSLPSTKGIHMETEDGDDEVGPPPVELVTEKVWRMLKPYGCFLFGKRDHADYILRTGDLEIPISVPMLACRSSTFRSMFDEERNNSGSDNDDDDDDDDDDGDDEAKAGYLPVVAIDLAAPVGSCFEELLRWIYTNDGEHWMRCFTPANYHNILQNICFLNIRTPDVLEICHRFEARYSLQGMAQEVIEHFVDTQWVLRAFLQSEVEIEMNMEEAVKVLRILRQHRGEIEMGEFMDVIRTLCQEYCEMEMEMDMVEVIERFADTQWVLRAFQPEVEIEIEINMKKAVDVLRAFRQHWGQIEMKEFMKVIRALRRERDEMKMEIGEVIEQFLDVFEFLHQDRGEIEMDELMEVFRALCQESVKMEMELKEVVEHFGKVLWVLPQVHAYMMRMRQVMELFKEVLPLFLQDLQGMEHIIKALQASFNKSGQSPQSEQGQQEQDQQQSD
ncbi:hypothetical protein BGX26_003615 [Mortierella sp. AD094]|nr:hypothetical protein BGX26_003615 [Mortierella sp. AD094]